MESPLLNKVIKETFYINNNVTKISNARELLELSTVTYEKERVEVRTPGEQYQRKLFIDALEDIGFFYQEYLKHMRKGEASEELEYVSQKQAKLLEFIEEDLDQIKEALFEQLHSKEDKILTIVIYILSSVEKEIESSLCLNKVLAEFSRCNAEQLPCYIDALSHGSHGSHPQLTNGLNLVQEIATENIKEACSEILRYRKSKI